MSQKCWEVPKCKKADEIQFAEEQGPRKAPLQTARDPGGRERGTGLLQVQVQDTGEVSATAWTSQFLGGFLWGVFADPHKLEATAPCRDTPLWGLKGTAGSPGEPAFKEKSPVSPTWPLFHNPQGSSIMRTLSREMGAGLSHTK